MTHREFLVLWYSNPVSDILLLIVLFVRRRVASFPIFTACLTTDATIFIVVTYVAYHYHPLYWKVFWPLKFLQEAVDLLVAYEISTHVFRPAGVWASDVRKPLIGIAGGGIVVAFLFALLAHPAIHPHSVLMWRIDFFAAVLMVELFVGMLVLSSVVGLPWKTHAMRIAQVMCLGWFLSLLIEIVSNSVSLAHLNHIYPSLVCLQMTLGLASMVYWFITLWQDEPTPQKLPETMRNQIYTLQQQAENELIRIRSWRNN